MPPGVFGPGVLGPGVLGPVFSLLRMKRPSGSKRVLGGGLESTMVELGYASWPKEYCSNSS